MNKQLVAAVALSALALALTPVTGFAQQDPKAPSQGPQGEAKPANATPAATATEDIIYMRDGRVLHGKILAKTSKFVTFEYFDKGINVKTKMNLPAEDVVEIQKDVAVAGAPAAAAGEKAADDSGDAAAATLDLPAKKKNDFAPSYGAARFQTNDKDVPSFYIVPMWGQYGTDVRADVYKPVIEDIRKCKPTLVILDVRAADSFPPDLLDPFGYDMPKTDPKLERGMLEFEDYRELVHMFRDELPDVRQIVWIKDADGISATVSMAWDQIYMHPDARFGGMLTVLDQSGANKWADSDVRAKMMAAWLGIAKSFLEKGGYSLALADAMLDPTKTLSGSWKGREMEWQLNKSGEYIVDDSEKHPVDFLAKTAEDFCLSQGTADDLDDLALLLNYREYRVIDGKQNDLTIGYVEDWRRVFAKCRQLLQDYQKHLSWASGNDAVKYLGKAKSDLEGVLAGLNQYKAVEIRLGTDAGLDKITLMTYIDQLKEQLAALRQRAKTGGTGGGSGRAGNGGRAGGGPGGVGG